MEYAVFPASLPERVCVVMGNPNARNERLSRSNAVRRASSASGYCPDILFEMSSKVSGRGDSVSNATRLSIRSVEFTVSFLPAIQGRIDPQTSIHIHSLEMFLRCARYQDIKGCVKVSSAPLPPAVNAFNVETAIVLPNSTPNWSKLFTFNSHP